MELFAGGAWGNFAALVMSAPVDTDLLNADSWTFSDPMPKQEGFSWLEGAVLLAPDDKVVNILPDKRARATTERPSFMLRRTAARLCSIRRMT